MSHAEHRAAAPSHIRCYVITVSDSRTEDTDTGGRLLRELLTEGGHLVLGHTIVRDDPVILRAAIERQLNMSEVQAVITTGGTGISRRDGSYEVVTELLDKRLDGFGELFRSLSFAEIGPSAMLSRACAGTARGKILVSLPGSQNAVRLGLTKLILPELGHLVREVTR
ncbi:MAG: MogA/MoaB family molybdenum cofactor biosynthesis protein [Acidobacteriota bacterium]|nr:MogA/MoaB family molybdenum cofactor biosynthesis protein [Acidobacteriota bacterium]